MLVAGVTSAYAGEPVEAQSAEQAAIGVKVVPAGSADEMQIKQSMKAAMDKLGRKPTTLAEVDRWSDALTAMLRQSGFPIGVVLMTDSDWTSMKQGGPGQFTVFPGRIRQIKLQNKSRVADARLQRLINHALCGKDSTDGVCVLKSSRLERTTQLLQDVPGVAIEKAPQISPGAGTGDVDVSFAVAQLGKPVSVDLVMDNNGSESTGKYQFGLTGSANNVFHAGDAYAMTITSTDKKMITGSLSASTPIFDDGLRATAGISRQQYNINVGTPTKGVATTEQVGVRYPFTRGLDANVWGAAALLHSNSNTEFTEYGQSAKSSINSLQLSMQADNGDRARQLRTNIMSGQVALTLGNLRNDDSNDSVTHRAGTYGKVTGNAFTTYAFTPSGNLFGSARINSQLASRNLDGSEKLGFSGPNAVRAYRSDEGSFDDGVVLNLGIYQRVPVASGHQLQFGAFTDFALGRINHSAWDGFEKSYPNVPGGVTNTRKLAGYGVSVDWLTPIGATVSATVSKPFWFSESSWVEPGKKPTQFWLSVSWTH